MEKFRNRARIEYWFSPIGENRYVLGHDKRLFELDYRFGFEKEAGDFSNLKFIDPSDGPFLGVGMLIEGRKVVRIKGMYSDNNEDSVFLFEVE